MIRLPYTKLNFDFICTLTDGRTFRRASSCAPDVVDSWRLGRKVGYSASAEHSKSSQSLEVRVLKNSLKR